MAEGKPTISLTDGVIHVRAKGRTEHELEVLMQQEGTRGVRASRHKVIVAPEDHPVYKAGEVDFEERAAFGDGSVSVQVYTSDGELLAKKVMKWPTT